MAVAVVYAGVAAEPVRVWWLFSFLTKHRVKCTCEPCGRSWVVERIEVRSGRRTTFGRGVAVHFVALLPVCRSWAPTSLCRGGYDCGVVASSSVPQGVRGFQNSLSFLVVTCADRLPHGRR